MLAPALPARDDSEIDPVVSKTRSSTKQPGAMRAVWAIAIVLCVTLAAGCSSGDPPLTMAQAAAAFTSAYNSFIARGRQIEKLSPPDQPASPAADNDTADALTAFGNKLKSIRWPATSSSRAQAVESVLTKEAAESRALSRVKSTDPAIVTDYRNFDATARSELALENKLRAAIGLPDRR